MTVSKSGKSSKDESHDGTASRNNKAVTSKEKRPAKKTALVNSEEAKPAEGAVSTALPVVGIVASAGGLAAFKSFLQHMPADSGAAFVLIPHLDPRHDSLMAQLLDKQTVMPVIEAEDGLRLTANHVYVIPPDRYLSLKQGVIHLSPLPSKLDVNAPPIAPPIDPFLRSLAEDQQEHAICIILSGTGSYGALGLKAVKAAGGMAMVQDPATAEYDSMPLSAIDSGLADYILPPERMPGELLKYMRHFLVETAVLPDSPDLKDELNQVLELLKARTKFDFRAYRKRMLLRRIQRRMGLNHLDRLADYRALLRDRPDELTQLCKDLFISVTSFFRDPEMFKLLESEVCPELINGRDSDTPIRVWVPGCATGEEAYSIAMLLIECLDAMDKDCRVQVFATDVDENALEIARRGIYQQAMMQDMEPRRLKRFFTKISDQHWQAKKQLREAVLFAPQNILSDPPFSKLDIVSCRNLLIYLETEIQHNLLGLFYFALNEGGYLILGPSESVGRLVEQYKPISKKWRIFRRVGGARPLRSSFPVPAGRSRLEPQHAYTSSPALRGNLTDTIQKILLEEYAPAAVVIDGNFEVLHYYGPTHLYLQQPGGAPSSDLLSLAHATLRPRIRAALSKAKEEKSRFESKHINITRDGRAVPVRIAVQPLLGPRVAEGLFLVLFEDEPEAAQNVGMEGGQACGDESLLRQLEEELKTTREELRSTIEELESSNEELKASNEEAMSMNEELQSTNEELETSKEELQSLNEELGTVNAQLQDKVEELESTTNDMANLISSVDTAILFLGIDGTIQRFTPSVTRLLNLRDSDLGRPLSDITMRLEDPDLTQDIAAVLRDLSMRQKEVHGENGQWYLRQITPYRTEDNHIEGAVLTFTDITALKQAELELRKMAETLEQRVEERSEQLRQESTFSEAVMDTVASLILVIDADERVVRFNKACEKVTGYSFDKLVGTTDWWDLIPQDDVAGVRGALDRLRAGEKLVTTESRWRTKKEGMRLVSWNHTALKDVTGNVQFIISSGLDITEQRKVENEARQHLEEASRLQRVQTANEVATLLAHEINQPLLAITMFADTSLELLSSVPLDQRTLMENMQQVSQQALRAGETIRRLRTFVSQSTIDPTPLDLNRVIERACKVITRVADENGIHLVLDLNEAVPPVMGVDVHLEQVMLNLLRNAIEAIRDAGILGGSITVETRREERMAHVTVRDNGPGINEKMAGKLFGSLTSTKDYGLGVGLRISRSLIEAHGGRLWVEPHTPCGIFHFLVPLAP